MRVRFDGVADPFDKTAEIRVASGTIGLGAVGEVTDSEYARLGRCVLTVLDEPDPAPVPEPDEALSAAVFASPSPPSYPTTPATGT